MLAPMAEAGLEIGGVGPDPVLQGADERPVRLEDLRGEGALVAIFLRHFG
jgi:hypothetical protein